MMAKARRALPHIFESRVFPICAANLFKKCLAYMHSTYHILINYTIIYCYTYSTYDINCRARCHVSMYNPADETLREKRFV